MSKTRGRKPKSYPKNEIDNIVYRFTQEQKTTGLIRYMDVFRFSTELHENREIEYKLSEDFWRKEGRQGRQTIDNFNQVYEHTVSIGEQSQEEKLVDTLDCVNKFYTGKIQDKEKLINALKINENKARKYIQESQRLKAKTIKLAEQLEEEKQKKKHALNKIDKYEQVIFSWMYLSSSKNVPLVNLITTGTTRHKVVDFMFNTLFSDNSVEGYERLAQFQKKVTNSLQGNYNNNVVDIHKKESNSLLEDLDL
jgi:hypothetical protein